MPLWMRNLIMLGVFGAWLCYMTVVFAHGDYPPLPAWFVPGATFSLLSGRVVRFGQDGVSVEKEEDKK